jgi:hypothetical protein
MKHFYCPEILDSRGKYQKFTENKGAHKKNIAKGMDSFGLIV